MKPLIREITPADFGECAEVIRESFQTVAIEFGFTIENNPTNGAFIKAEKLAEDYHKGMDMFGILIQGRLVGFVAAEKKDEAVYYLEKLAVLPRYRNNGFGGLLINHVLAYVKANGGEKISIAIINENNRLKNWYKGLGFEQTGLKRFDHLTFTVCFMMLSV